MKRRLTLLLGLISFSTIGISQSTISNQGFENWEQVVVKDSIEYWQTSTQLYQLSGADINNAYQINSAQDGLKAVHVETVLAPDENGLDTLIGFVNQMDADEDFIGFPYSDIVTNLKGWYKCNNIANDTALAMVILKNNGIELSQTIYKFTGIVSTWTQFDMPITNGGTITPDSIWIGFVSSNFQIDDEQQEGNWLEIDNIWFENSGTVATSIPGHSFENLIQISIEQPTDWWSFDKFSFLKSGTLSVTKSTDAVEGSSSLRIEKTQTYDDEDLIPIVTNGLIDFQNGLIGGIPFIAQPATYSFQYKYTPNGLDTAIAIVNFLNNGTTLNINDSITQLLPSLSWTTHTFNLSFSQTPDSIRVSFFTGDSIGSVLLIDDIQFLGGDVSTEELAELNNWIIYPNPVNTELNIKNVENTTISIFDISGKNVFMSANNSNLTQIETSNWNNGVYFIKIRYNNTVETKKIVIRH